MTTINEEDLMANQQQPQLPFLNTQEQRDLLQDNVDEYLKDTSLASFFGDIDEMGVEFDDTHFVEQD